MKTLKFRSNINCENCIRKVTNFIEAIENIDTWEVDTVNPDKILTIEGNDDLNSKVIVEIIEEAGYSVELL